MILRKQTVWLLTMLAVMVVLSGYYLVKGPGEQPAIGEEPKQVEPLMGVEVDTKQTDQPPTDATPVEAKSTTVEEATPKAAADLPAGSDYFQGYKLKREAMMQQQKDEQMKIMTSSEATPQAVAEAKKKHDELSDMEAKVLALEELIKAEGYKDVVVNAQNGTVSVIVQKDGLEAKEAVHIIGLVKQHMKVSGQDVRVLYHQ